MSDRRSHRNRPQGLKGGSTAKDGLGHSKPSETQPSRRSSRERVPTRKINLGPHNTSSKDYNISIFPPEEFRAPHPRGSGGQQQNGATSKAKKSPEDNGNKKKKRKRSLSLEHGDDDTDRQQPRGEQDESNGVGHDSDEDEKDGIEQQIMTAAEKLLKLDGKVYKENLVCDADSIVSRLLLPIALPWTHHKSDLGLRTMPRDIDEIPEILNVGETVQRSMYNGRPGTKTKKEEEQHGSVRLSLHRGDDPGVLELRRQFHLPPEALDVLEERRETLIQDSGLPVTSTKLRMDSFLEAAAAKRRRLDLTPLRTDAKHISIRFGSSSSRSNIFPSKNSPFAKQPLLLQASFAEDRQTGKKVSVHKANELSRQLGSYDHRFGLTTPSAGTGRVRAGRSRIMWSSKAGRTYQSLITGNLLHGREHRMPSRVAVGIRINGRLLTAKTPSLGATPDSVPYSNREIEAALAAAYDDSDYEDETTASDGSDATVNGDKARCLLRRPNAQCSLDVQSLLPKLMKSDQNKILVEARKSFHVKSRLDSFTIFVRPPVIQCTPTEDGIIQTTCEKPGTISNEAIASGPKKGDGDCIHATGLLDEIAARSMACAVCWSSDITREDIVRCRTCNIQVHASCHCGSVKPNGGKANKHWQCNMCVSTSRQDHKSNGISKGSNDNDASSSMPRPESEGQNMHCQYCPIIGGPMSESSSSDLSHDICMRWCPTGAVGQCVLCSMRDKAVVKCAAVGCSIRFHPMCAVVASKAALQQRCQRNVSCQFEDNGIATDSSFDEMAAKEDDLFKSTQYKLVMSRVSAIENEQTGLSKEHFVPLAFCGIHNRERLPEFYGLPPGGVCYEKMLRVPPPP